MRHMRQTSTDLLGRAALITDLETQLAGTRLLTLVGPGGVGKTSLAWALVEGRDAYWIDLAPVLDGAFVPATVAAACAIVEQGGRSWREALVNELRDSNALLVLDNCEHVRLACTDLCSALLDACPGLKILATSRMPLRIPGEACAVVPPLDLPAAQQLFSRRAAARVPHFTLDAITEPLVTHICTQLDGMPLALELATARLPLLTVAQIAERLNHGLLLLAGRNENTPARQRSLRATLDWSYALLSDPERALFRRLAVFAGSFDLEAVEAICNVPAALDLVEILIDAALLTIVARDEAGRTRYRLHEVPRQYAADQLAAAGETETYRRRHIAWAIALAERVAPELDGARQAVWLRQVALDHENLRTALTTAEQAAESESMLRLVNALVQFWNVSDIGEGRAWLRRALRLSEGQITSATAGAWSNESFLAYRQGDYAAMKAAAEMALNQALLLEDERNIADAHYRLGIYDEMQNHLIEAREHYQYSLDMYQQLHVQRGVSNVLNGLAHVARLSNDPAEARRYYEQGLALARATNDQRTTMLLLISLGNLLLDQDWERAEPLFAESLALIRTLGETSYLPYVANGLGEIAYSRGDLPAAAAQYEAGLETARMLKLDDMSAQLLLKRAYVAIEAADLALAVPLVSESLHIYAQNGRTARVVEGVYVSARLIGRLGYPARAITLFMAGMQAASVSDFNHVGGREAENFTTAFAAAQAVLTPAECASSLAAGQALSLQQAVNLALSAIHLPPRTEHAAPPELQLFTFGALRVLRHGHELTAEDWVYTKTRELLLYLLHVPSASKEQIGAALWPDASERQIKQNFRMAIYHLRRALGRAEWITFIGGRYAFNRTLEYWHDEAAFTAALAQAAHDPAQRATYLQQAVDLYHGDLALESLDSEVLLVRREQMRQQAINALLELGALHLAAGMFSAAADTYRRAITLDSYLEAAHRGLLRALAHQNERGLALAHYQSLQSLLHHDLGVDPDHATRALAVAINRGDPPDRL